MKRSIKLTFEMIVVLGLLLSACTTPAASPTAVPEATTPREPTAAPPEATTPPEPTAAPEPVSITMWSMPNGPDPQAAIDAEIAAFMEEHPDIEVTAEIVDWGSAFGRIQTAVQGGEGPCVTQVGTTWVPTFGSMGGLRNFSAEEIADMGGEENFVAASWETAALGDNVVSIPWVADVRAVAYRTDILEQVGLTAEEAFADLDALEAALVAIKDAGITDADGNPVYPFVHPGRNDWNVWQNASMWIWAYGGDLLTTDGAQAAFNSEEAAAGVARFNSLFAKGLTTPDALELNSSQTDAAFGNGQVAMYITGPYIVTNSRTPAEDGGWASEDAAANWAFAEFPPGPGGQYTFIGGSNLVILGTCPEPGAALEFVKYLISNESQVRYATAVGLMPATVEGQADPYFADDPIYQTLIEAAQKGKTSVNIPQWGVVETNLQTALQALWEDVAALGTTPIAEDAVKARLDEAAATVNALLQP